MKIEERVEAPVREGFAAVIAQDERRFVAAINDISSRGDDFFRDAMTLATEICFATLVTLHKGQRPPHEQLEYIAREAVASEEWAALDGQQTRRFLTAVADREPIDEDLMSLADATQLTFVVGGFLLGAFLTPGKHWYNLLDEVESWLAAMPTN